MNEGEDGTRDSPLSTNFLSHPAASDAHKPNQRFCPSQRIRIVAITDIPMMIMEVRRKGNNNSPRGIRKTSLHGRRAVGQEVAISLQLNTFSSLL
jgi:hypothetical protein